MAVSGEAELVCLLISLPDCFSVAGVCTYRKHHPFLCAVCFRGDGTICSCYESAPADKKALPLSPNGAERWNFYHSRRFRVDSRCLI